MVQARLSMRKIEEVLRLKYEVGLTHRKIAQSGGIVLDTFRGHKKRLRN
jgi:hypothetical protein